MEVFCDKEEGEVLDDKDQGGSDDTGHLYNKALAVGDKVGWDSDSKGFHDMIVQDNQTLVFDLHISCYSHDGQDTLGTDLHDIHN